MHYNFMSFNAYGIGSVCTFAILNFCMVGSIDSITGLRRKIKKLWEESANSGIGKALRNKYILTAVVFVLWLLLFDQNNLAERRKSTNKLNQLREEKSYYLQKIEEDRKRINELKTNIDNLEKFAREQYLMKKDNEDIFIIVEE